MEHPALRARIADNLSQVRGRIDAAAGGRKVSLVCVTKYAQLEWVEALLNAGADSLGENLLPAASDRFSSLRDKGYSFERHLLGAPQSRRTRLVPGNFEWLQALDSVETAERLQAAFTSSDAPLNTLLQVNIGGESQKHGLDTEKLESVVECIYRSCPSVVLRGLMAIPPGPDSYEGSTCFEEGTRSCFRQMRALFDRISVQRRSLKWDTLSMGMSQDYELAIAEGATMVRIGSALFEGV